MVLATKTVTPLRLAADAETERGGYLDRFPLVFRQFLTSDGALTYLFTDKVYKRLPSCLKQPPHRPRF
jgi:hypothetical protein